MNLTEEKDKIIADVLKKNKIVKYEKYFRACMNEAMIAYGQKIKEFLTKENIGERQNNSGRKL